MPLWWSLPLVGLLIAVNAFFAAAEYALVAVRVADLEAMKGRGRLRAARAVERLKAEPASALGAIQVCITLTNLLLGWIAQPVMSAVLWRAFTPLAERTPPRVLAGVSLVLSFLLITLLVVVLGELLPKALSLRHTAGMARATAAPVLALLAVVRPLVWLIHAAADLLTRPLGLGRVSEMEKEWHTPEEIRHLADEAAEQGQVTPGERTLIVRSLALSRRVAREIMVPRVRVAYLDLRRSMDENRRVMNERLYSRMPLCDGEIDRVVGVVPTKEFLTAYHAAGDASVLGLLAQDPVFAPDTVPVERLLELFHLHRAPLLFLVDEYGGVAGIVTLRDVLDELVGELGKPATEPGAAPREADEGGFACGGDTPLRELAERLDRRDWCAAETAVTLSGLIVDRLGHIPAAGEELVVEAVRLRVLESDHRLARRVLVRPVETPASGTEPSSEAEGGG